MELRHIRYFVAVADTGSVSAAARSVHVTQPALSRQVRQLESDLGVTLFERSGGRATPSRVGRLLLPQARALLDSAAALHSEAAFHAAGGLRQLTVAAPTVTLTDVVAPFVAEMSTSDPVVDVRASDGGSVASMLQTGADLAIGNRPAPRPFASLPLAVLPVWAYVRPGDAWASAGSVSLTTLRTRPLVVLPSAFTAREALDAALASSAATTLDAIEAANGTVAQALAAAGRGVAVVTDDPRFDLVPLGIVTDSGLLSIRLVASWDAASAAAGELQAVAERLREWIRGRYDVSRPRVDEPPANPEGVP